jgi:hypothetical protein
MIQWLYRYVFRGIGFALIAGMITILILAINSQLHRAPNPQPAPVGAHR